MAEIENYEDVGRLLRSALLDHEWEANSAPWSTHRKHNFLGTCGICQGDVASIVVVLLGAIENHPTQTIRHYAPTQWAYDQACKALEKHRTRADEAQAVIERVRELHTEFRLYDDCGHLHDEEGDAEVKAIVEDLGPVCQDGYVSSICRSCCAGGGDGQTECCASDHDGPCWPCATVRALDPSDTAGRP